MHESAFVLFYWRNMKLSVQEYTTIRDELEKAFKTAVESIEGSCTVNFSVKRVQYKIHIAATERDNQITIRIIKKEGE